MKYLIFKFIAFVILIALNISCDESNFISMEMPENKAPLLNHTKGLGPEIQDQKVVMEKYLETRMGNAEANKLLSNGDLYKVFLGSTESLAEEEIEWSKVGSISENGLKIIERIIEKHVKSYLEDQPEPRDNPVEDIDWYFYFNDSIYVHSQTRSFYPRPKFVRKIDNAIKNNFSPNIN